MRKRKFRPRAGHRTRFNRAPGSVSQHRPIKHIPPELPTDGERRALALRIYRLVEAEVAASEAAVARLGSVTDPASEKAVRARALGALARALQSANALCHPQPSIDTDEPDDPPARTVEELEHAILKHLEDFERERAVELARKDETG